MNINLWEVRRSWPLGVARWLACASLGAVVVGYLAMFAHSLIAVPQARLADDVRLENPHFIRLKQASDVKRRSRELPKKQQPQPQPDMPTISLSANDSRERNISDLKVDVPEASPAAAWTPTNFALVGNPGLRAETVVRPREYTPFARPKPVYPSEARDREIEGWVDLTFTVTRNGSVGNPRVVKASPPSVFNRAALDAVKKWKYRPRIEAGKAVAVPGVTTRISFRINDR